MNVFSGFSFKQALMLAIVSLPLAGGCGAFYPPLAVVDYVDLTRYAGKWYEIARYPNSFERVAVLNTCVESSLDGPERPIRGSARVVDSTTNAKLKVTFFWPFEGDYWIIDLDEDYTYAVVGEPSRQFLWILSRAPQMDDETYERIIESLPDYGYDPDRLILVPQDEAAE